MSQSLWPGETPSSSQGSLVINVGRKRLSKPTKSTKSTGYVFVSTFEAGFGRKPGRLFYQSIKKETLFPIHS
jgi:hypothetical protein